LMHDLSGAKSKSGEDICAFLELQDHGPDPARLKKAIDVARRLEELGQQGRDT
jgi:hypothetical protein